MEKLRELSEKATQGKWLSDDLPSVYADDVLGAAIFVRPSLQPIEQSKIDHEFAALCVNDVRERLASASPQSAPGERSAREKELSDLIDKAENFACDCEVMLGFTCPCHAWFKRIRVLLESFRVEEFERVKEMAAQVIEQYRTIEAPELMAAKIRALKP